MKLKIPLIRKTLESVLLQKGIPSEEAKVVADEYLQGELQGKASHGLMVFPALINKLEGKPKKIKILKKTNSTVLIDANENIGAYVGRIAADKAIKLAQKEGIGLALIKNQVTWLRPGTVAKYIADKGFISLVVNNGGRPMTAPPGGFDPVIGTNPVGIGIPTEKESIVADMATSTRAWGEVKKAEREKKDLPANIYFDNKGEFVVKPEDAYSALAMGGYKGFALGLLIEVLTGSFLGRLMGQHQMKGDYRTLTRGGVIIVFNPKFSTSINEFKKANTRLVKEIKLSRKLKGVKEIFLPGERAAQTKQANENKGYLDVDDKLWEQLQKL